MKAKTFYDAAKVEVEILSAPSSTGLVKVKWGDKVLVRKVPQLEPLDDEAKELLENYGKK